MDVKKKTFVLDTIRGGADGVLAAIVNTVILLVAIEVFHLSDFWKSQIAAAPFIGCILSLIYSAVFSKTRLRKSTLASMPMLICCIFATMLPFINNGIYFSIIAIIAMAFSWIRLPFLSGIYQENYDPTERGSLYSWSLISTIVVTLLCSYIFGKMLDIDMQLYRIIMFCAVIASAISAGVVHFIPSTPPDMKSGSNPLKNLSLLWKDKLFGYILFTWFIIGFANLWTRALRIVYLSKDERGIGLSPFTVMIIAGVVPEAARLLFTRFWANLFDRINFIILRIALNLFLGIGLLLFFVSENPYIIGVGSFFIGICFSGGGVAWNLWVTKCAPKGQAHIYMSIHSALMGVRGIVGPYIGFLFIYSFPIKTIGYVSCIMVVIASTMLFPVVKYGDRLKQ